MHDHADHHHGHYHGHHHHHVQRKSLQMNRLMGVFALLMVYMLCEIWGGWFSHSLTLLADAGHLFSDGMVLGLAMAAVWIAKRPPTDTRTFGYDRAEVLAALVNACFLIGVAGMICYEAILRFAHPVPVKGGILFLVATGGLLVNLLAARLLHSHQEQSLNVRGAYLHILTDLMGSAAAMLAGLGILLLGWWWVDPVMGMLVSLLVLLNGIGLLREALDILLEGAPADISVPEVEAALLARQDVKTVHHLHVWSINTDKVVLTAHLVVVPGAFTTQTLSDIQRSLKEEFGLSHVTLQLEEG